jgi:3-oxoacyl-[acyl-carrier-protein] synthase-3
MSSATIPVSLVEALEDNRVEPGGLILMPAFGAGLTWSSHLVRWGTRTTPLGESSLELPPARQTALERVRVLAVEAAQHRQPPAAPMSSRKMSPCKRMSQIAWHRRCQGGERCEPSARGSRQLMC